MNEKSGIYAIEHAASGKLYIGSSKDIAKRWKIHRCLLSKGTHHSPHFQAAWSKYSADAFTFRVLIRCAVEHLIMFEQRCIDGYQSFKRDKGYNARREAASQLGMKHSAAALAKMRAANLGRKASPETRALLSKMRTGKKMPAWFGAFTAAHKTGSKHTDETKAKISAVGIGRPCSLSTRQRKAKLSVAQVLEVKQLFTTGSTQTAIAKRFGVDQSMISLIVHGKRWSVLT